MRAGEKLVASDGYEVMLFPLEYMNISQGEGGSGSHAGTYSMDFMGWGANGRVYTCPVYAPCTCKCTNVNWDPAGGSRVFTSVNKVHCPDGTLDYITFNTVHDNNPISSLNQVFQQGDLIAHTGTAYHSGSVGDHVHLNVALGDYQGFYDVGTGHYQLRNSRHIYDTCFVNDTTIIDGLSYNWQTYNGGITPKKYHFKWVLYANKIRERNIV